MNEYQEMVLSKLLAPMVILLVIAVVYFISSKNQTIWSRVFVASHALIAFVAAVYAIIISQYTSATSFDPHTVNFSKILAIAVIFGFVAVFNFKGSKKTHLLLLPFVFCVAFIWHFGGFAITHNWT